MSREVSIWVKEVNVSSVLEFYLHCFSSSAVLEYGFFYFTITERGAMNFPCV